MTRSTPLTSRRLPAGFIVQNKKKRTKDGDLPWRAQSGGLLYCCLPLWLWPLLKSVERYILRLLYLRLHDIWENWIGFPLWDICASKQYNLIISLSLYVKFVTQVHRIYHSFSSLQVFYPLSCQVNCRITKFKDPHSCSPKSSSFCPYQKWFFLKYVLVYLFFNTFFSTFTNRRWVTITLVCVHKLHTAFFANYRVWMHSVHIYTQNIKCTSSSNDLEHAISFKRGQKMDSFLFFQTKRPNLWFLID